MKQPQAPKLSPEEASVYEDFFVPALFGPWAAKVADAARLQPGDRVLDVACGTGVLAREAATRVGSAGEVIGLDPVEGMLSVAARKSPGIEWRKGLAESLLFSDADFDAVLSQFGLMFFHDPPVAIREMTRVLRPGGRLAAAVWDEADRIPAYRAFIDLLHNLFGGSVAHRLRAPFAMGDRERLLSIFAEASGAAPSVTTLAGAARFPSIRDWVHADAAGWLQLEDDEHQKLLDAAQDALKSFLTPEGTVAFTMSAHIVTATKI